MINSANLPLFLVIFHANFVFFSVCMFLLQDGVSKTTFLTHHPAIMTTVVISLLLELLVRFSYYLLHGVG